MTRTLSPAAAFAALALASPAAAQPTLDSLLRVNRHVMTVETDGAISGPGARLLLDAGRDAHFFLVGEEHGVAEVPVLTAWLFRELVPAGYRHLAIETGDGLAEAMNRALVDDPSGRALVAFQRAHWPGIPFFSRREEAELARAAVAAAGDRADVLWGLDYDILADRYALRRLRDIAPSPEARALADSVIALADSALARMRAERNPGHVWMFGGAEDVYPRLRQAYAPAPGSEADRIIHLMQETRAINGLFVAGQGWASNHRRALLNKRRFMDRLRQASADTGEMPRVMLKFGASHMMRGRTFTEVLDLGTLASELADVHGSRSFGVLVMGGPGTLHAVTDPTVMASREVGVEMAESAWGRPFAEAADPAAWTVFDLRPLRPVIRRLGLSGDLEKVLYGFDAVIVLSGSGPQTDLDLN